MFSELRSGATLNSSVEFSGIGVHSGLPSNMTISPSDGTGILFKRTDIKDKSSVIKLSAESVVDPTLCTRVTNKAGVSVAVIEHLLAAFRICGITDAIIEIDSPEVPIMDGSAIEFVKAFKQAGIVRLGSTVQAIVITEPVMVSSKNGMISITPSDECEISIRLDYDRIKPVIGQNNSYSFSLSDNLTELAAARTFGWIADYEKVVAMGLAKGTSEDNTIVIMNDNSIKNKGGLRNPKEIVMHKCLDLLGDISVIGYDIIGKIEGLNTSHALNNLLMRKLLSEISKHEVIRSNASKNFVGIPNFA